MKTYTCFIHRPGNSMPNFLAVSCFGVDRAMVHAVKAASEWSDWESIEVFEGPRRVAIRERETTTH